MKKQILFVPILFLALFSHAQNVGIEEPNPTQARLVVKGSQNGLENILLLKNGFNDSAFRVGNALDGHWGTFRTPGVFNLYGSGDMLRLQGINPSLSLLGTNNNYLGYLRHKEDAVNGNSLDLATGSSSGLPITISPGIFDVNTTFLTDGKVTIGSAVANQKLNIAGAISLGTTTTNTAGTLRYNNSKLEVGNGTTWSSWDNLPSGTIVASNTYSSSNPLLANGFSFYGIQNSGTKTYTASSGNVSSFGAWINTYLYGNPSALTPSLINPLTDLYTATGAGNDVYIVGGAASSFLKYNTLTDIYTNMPTSGLPGGNSFGLSGHKAVWTGSKLMIWGGYNNGYINTGYIFDPATSTWSAMSTTNAPAGREYHKMIWTGSKLVVWGGYNNGGYLNSGGIYDPSLNSWTTISTIGAPSIRWAFAIAWHNDQLLIWGGKNNASNGSGGTLNDGAFYNPTNSTWTSISNTNAPFFTYPNNSFYIYTGTNLYAFGNNNESGSNPHRTFKYNIQSNTWTQMASIPSDPGIDFSSFYTGTNVVLAAGWQTNGSTYSPTGISQQYNINTDAWSVVGGNKNNLKRRAALACTTNSCCFIFGGEVEDGRRNSGARYF